MTNQHYFTGKNPNGPIIILAHGATMTHFKETHILVKTLKEISSYIISLDLPGHGRNQLKGNNPISFENASKDFNKTIFQSLREIKDKTVLNKIGLIGFSLGGMFAMRMKNPPFDFAIYMGCGTHFNEEQLQRIHWFFSEATYRRFKLTDNLLRDHGPHWQVMLEMIHSWFSDDSEMIKSPVNHLSIPSLFILAENDQTFDSSSIQVEGKYEVLTVIGDHFSYFNPKPFHSYKTTIIDFIRRSIS
ncbi:MAG: alpha/beta fold hydrolase [Candidatus Kariarchaeaceae archaeon]|jgi:esterase/lipase